MNKLILGALALTVIAASCKKSEDSGPTNTYSVNGTSHSPSTVVRQALINGLQAVEGNGTSASQVLVSFKTLPTADGTYKVVSSADSANQVDITYQSGANLYDSYDKSTANATVTVSGGKIKIVVPEIYLKSSTTANDSVKFSATLTEQ